MSRRGNHNGFGKGGAISEVQSAPYNERMRPIYEACDAEFVAHMQRLGYLHKPMGRREPKDAPGAAKRALRLAEPKPEPDRPVGEDMEQGPVPMLDLFPELRPVVMEEGEIIEPVVAPKSFYTIVAEVARKHGLRVADLKGPMRMPNMALARQEAVYLLREERQASWSRIGNYLGGRDHTTALYSYRRHAARLAGVELIRKKYGKKSRKSRGLRQP